MLCFWLARHCCSHYFDRSDRAGCRDGTNDPNATTDQAVTAQQPADPAQQAADAAKQEAEPLRRKQRLRNRPRLRTSRKAARSSLPAFAGAFRTQSTIKRRERSVVEAVSAEEIGKLPDISIAESIARLPGIAAQRVKGRAEIVSIRGFSPDFTTVLLNGRQQASSGFNRAVEFDQYPSELMGSVVVYKTPDASISGMGLAGTVDLRTIRPLEYGKRAIAVNLRGQLDQGGGRNDDFSKYGWRGSASYIDQNEDGTLGWMMSYAHLNAPSHINETKNWFYGDYGDGVANPVGRRNPCDQTARDIRDGITGTVEWKPSDVVHSVLDLYYSRFKQDTTTRGTEWYLVSLDRRRDLQQRPGGRPRRRSFPDLRPCQQCRSATAVERQHAHRPSLLCGTEQRLPRWQSTRTCLPTCPIRPTSVTKRTPRSSAATAAARAGSVGRTNPNRPGVRQLRSRDSHQ